MRQIKIIKNNLLKEHERVIKTHLMELYIQIKKDEYIDDPIIVDKNTMIILDGHHRYNALKLLGLSCSPVCLC